MTERKDHVYLSEERMQHAVDEFVAGEKLSVVASRHGVSIGTVSRQTKKRGRPARVSVPNVCPHCRKKLVDDEQ